MFHRQAHRISWCAAYRRGLLLLWTGGQVPLSADIMEKTPAQNISPQGSIEQDSWEESGDDE